MSDAETASVMAALRGDLRWYCTTCKTRLAPDASPKDHGCPVIVAVEPLARTADEIHAMSGSELTAQLPPGWYWVSIAKNDTGAPLMVHGPFTHAEVSPS
jgi:hypothetical protein